MENQKKQNRLLIMFICFVVFQTIGIVCNKIYNYVSYGWVAGSVLMAVVSFFLYYTYRDHTKNVMKPLLGASLMVVLYYEMQTALDLFENFDEYVEYKLDADFFRAYVVLYLLVFVSLLGMNIMHYVINSTHHSSPKKIRLNQYIYVAFMVFVILRGGCLIFLKTSLLDFVGDFCACFADVFFINSVILIETNLDEFRIEREEKA